MTKSFFYILLTIIALFLVESAALQATAPDIHLVPQLLLLSTVALALDQKLPRVIWLAFISGLFLEAFSGILFGSYLFSLIGVVLLTNFSAGKVRARESAFAAGFFLTALNTFFFLFLIMLYGWIFRILGLSHATVGPGELFTARLLWTLLVNLLFFHPVKGLLRLVSRSDEQGQAAWI